MPKSEAETQSGTAARVRAILSKRDDVAERRMMGGMCFMVAGHMCCGASGARLMVRVGRDAYAAALSESHVRPLDLGGRRPVGYVLVDREGFASEALLRSWVDRALAAAASLPAR
jgi:TfoX/Sxy family transcriptional regulator of competence genes